MTSNNNQAQHNQVEEVDSLLKQKDFGTPLRLAREAAGLSVEEVAEKLIVSTDIIKAIDNSKADALPALTFTQGYIRNYARMLDVPADEIIDAYSSAVPDTKKVTTPQSVLLVHKTGTDVLIRFITFAFILAAIVGMFVWLYQTDLGLKLQGSVESNVLQGEGELVLEAPKPELAFRTEQQEEQAVLEALNVTDEPQSISAIDDQQLQVSQENIQEIVEAEVVEEKLTTEEPLKSTSQQPVIADENVVTGDDVLLLTAQGDSWCEIQDANGHRLYYQLIASGDEVNVRGQAPFRVFLGNAPDVRIEINQKIVSFDHLINTNSKIANLNIDTDASAVRFRNR